MTLRIELRSSSLANATQGMAQRQSWRTHWKCYNRCPFLATIGFPPRWPRFQSLRPCRIHFRIHLKRLFEGLGEKTYEWHESPRILPRWSSSWLWMKRMRSSFLGSRILLRIWSLWSHWALWCSLSAAAAEWSLFWSSMTASCCFAAVLPRRCCSIPKSRRDCTLNLLKIIENWCNMYLEWIKNVFSFD